jgi:hypothetical protein
MLTDVERRDRNVSHGGTPKLGRTSRTGVRGLVKDANDQYTIDFRWTDFKGRRRRFAKRLPYGIDEASACAYARQLTAAAMVGTFKPDTKHRRKRRAPSDGMPVSTSKEVQAVKASCSRARHVLLKKYGCSAFAEPGVGVRATFSDEDQARNEIPGRVKRVHSATSSLRASAEVLNPDKITDRELSSYATETKQQVKVIDDRMAKLRGLLGKKSTI